MRLSNHEITDRNNIIIKLRHKGETFKSIGNYFGISKQRVQQIYTNKCKIPNTRLPRIGKIIWNGKIKRILRRY